MHLSIRTVLDAPVVISPIYMPGNCMLGILRTFRPAIAEIMFSLLALCASQSNMAEAYRWAEYMSENTEGGEQKCAVIMKTWPYVVVALMNN
eukprot:97247-Chlamydomonas_euryale.AAC.2